jgi:hypothetical protein
VVWLAYILLVDKTIHVTWLRYWAGDAPYMSHINNSEMLTAILGISLVLYTRARIRTNVVFYTGEDEKPVGGGFASVSLLTLNTPHHKFRNIKPICWYLIVFMVWDAMLLNAIGDNKIWELIFALVSVLIWMATALGLVMEELFGELNRQAERHPHIDFNDPKLSAEERWECCNHGKIQL